MKRALVLRLSALGDVIHTIPAVTMLRGAFDVAWAVEAPYAELVEIVAGVPAVPLRMKKWGRAPWTSRRDIGAAFRAIRGFDVAVDFQGLIKSAALAGMSGARERFGFDRQAIREKAAGLFLNRRVAVDRTQHVIDWNIALAEAVLGALPRRPVAADWGAFAADPAGRLTGLTNRIVLLPGAGRPEKLWPVEHFREVSRRFGDRALVVWGPGERELARSIGGDIAPETNLRELAFLLAHASLVVAADTGPLHLAAALGVPVIGLYGPTDPRRNGPYGQLDRTFDEFRASKSMSTIQAQDVIRRIEQVLAK